MLDKEEFLAVNNDCASSGLDPCCNFPETEKGDWLKISRPEQTKEASAVFSSAKTILFFSLNIFPLFSMS